VVLPEVPAEAPVPGERVSLADAVGWLQRDSGHPLRVPIGVIGPRAATVAQLAVAEALGEGLATRGYFVVCGGRAGVMEAVCRGVAVRGGIAVGLTPDTDPALANPYAAIVLATGIGEARNAIIARASFCLIAVGNSHGTLSEVALGLHFGKTVIGLALNLSSLLASVASPYMPATSESIVRQLNSDLKFIPAASSWSSCC